MEQTINTKRRSLIRITLIVALATIITTASTHLRADSGACGGQTIALPFADVAGSIFFCDIAEAYFIGLTNGTDATHYSPLAPVPREQMAAFITRTQDSALRRGSRRAALNIWAKPDFAAGGFTDVGVLPVAVESDGEDLWVANFSSGGSVSRVRASDGRLLDTWTGATGASGVLIARGRIFVTGGTSPGALYRIDPKQSAGAVDVFSNNLGEGADGITTDGDFIWTANSIIGGPGSVSRVNPVTGNVTTFAAGFGEPRGILYDGSSVWVTDRGDGTLKRLNSDGTVAQSISIGLGAQYPIFDGTNIWIPAAALPNDFVTVVRVKDSQGNPLAAPFVLATLTGNGLAGPSGVAFDGQRILVTNFGGDTVSLWKAADLSPLGSISAPSGSSPQGACSDGINFWITFSFTFKLARL